MRPLRHITGQAEFAEVFFNDVKVPRENLVGELHGGWRITMGALAHERGGLWVEGVAGCLRAVDDIITMIKRLGLQHDAEYYGQGRQTVFPVPQLARDGLEGIRVLCPGQSGAGTFLHEGRHGGVAANAL